MPKNSSRNLPGNVAGLPWAAFAMGPDDVEALEVDDGLDLLEKAGFAAETGRDFSLTIPLDL